MNVTNQLTGSGNSTTIHWHGLHVPPEDDGGPHQVINQGATWSPKFKVMNDAGTFWYHPHGFNKTDRHVSKGIAGMIIVKDAQESTLNLPRTYGVDDIPLVIQTKEFDILNQIAIATFMDTLQMVNATINPYQNLPAQVVRLRLLNGASQRTFQLGFSNNMNFSLIGNDGGLLNAPQTMNRIRLANGERAEILLDLSTMLNDTIYLKCYGAELPKGIYGADSVGDAGSNQIIDYYTNNLNGVDFNLLQIRVTATTANPITTIPAVLTTLNPLIPDANTIYRMFEIDTIGGMGITPNLPWVPLPSIINFLTWIVLTSISY
jgi:bilirubin oxidase